MKHLIYIAITLVTLLFISCSVDTNSPTKVMNNDTGMKLTENLGVYSITGPKGALILGDIKESRDILWQMEKCFVASNLESLLTITINDQKYEVKSDDKGLYIIKVGLGAVKLRQSDVNQFLYYLESKIAKDKTKKIWDVITE